MNHIRGMTMVTTDDGYSIMQSNNRITIYVPQTWTTIETTAADVYSRTPYLTVSQEAALLAIVRAFFKGDEE